MYLRSAVVATIDDPRYNGIVMPGDRGHRRSWRFDDPSHYTRSIGGPSERSVKLTDEWEFSRGSFTMMPYPALRCIAPAPDYSQLKDCTLWDGNSGEWVVEHNIPSEPELTRSWREETPAPLVGIGAKKWLHWYDSRGMYSATKAYKGRVYYYGGSAGQGPNGLYWDPSFLFQAYRCAPDPDYLATHYTYFEIILKQRMANWVQDWSIGIPGPSGSAEKRPLYLGSRTSDGGTWEVMQRFETATPALDSNGYMCEVLQFETIDGNFLLSLWDGGTWEQFVYHIPDENLAPIIDGEFDPPSVLLTEQEIEVYGHAAKFNFSRLDFHGAGPNIAVPARADLAYTYPVNPTVFNVADADQNGTASAWLPTGTSVAVTGITENADSTGAILFRPRVTCEMQEPWTRPVVYVATVDWPPTITAGTTSGQYTTEGQDVLVSASGVIAEDWRQSTCDLTLEMNAADVAGIVTWKGNNRVQVRAGWQTDTGQTSAVQFTGYLRQRAHARRTDRPLRSVIELPCSDGFFRLEKKFWLDLGCFENSTVNDLFHRVLNQCGFPDATISVASDIAGIKVPRAVLGGEPRFDFREDTSVPDGLTQILAACGCVWGVDQTGTWFARAPSEYVDGTSTIAYTLDDDSVDSADLIAALRAETQFDELEDGRPFVNYVLVKIERGGEEQVVEIWDYDNTTASRSLSHHVSTDPNFIGDDWWAVMISDDFQKAYDLANRIIRDRAGDRESRRAANRRQTITFNADHQPNLFPGDYVRVQVTGTPIANNSIFQIVSKDWSCSETERLFTAQYTARFVQ